jgi:hypothetical protein
MAVTTAELDRLYRALPPRPTITAQVNALNVRPGPNQRDERTVIELDPGRGAIGDRWECKTWLYLPDGKPDPRVQVALCNSPILALIQSATGVNHHPGDTIFTNLDLSTHNLPTGSRLQIGPAILEISDVENDACAKFAAHYGTEVLEWIRLQKNRPLRLRGLFAKIVRGGQIRVGDTITKLTPKPAMFEADKNFH